MERSRPFLSSLCHWILSSTSLNRHRNPNIFSFNLGRQSQLSCRGSRLQFLRAKISDLQKIIRPKRKKRKPFRLALPKLIIRNPKISSQQTSQESRGLQDELALHF